MRRRRLLLVKIALRNVRRHARRSALTAAAMIVGLGLMVMSRALATGAHEGWVQSAVRLGSGHITIQGKGYQESSRLADRLAAHHAGQVKEILARPGTAERVVGLVGRLTVEALAGSATSAVPVNVMGVDATAEAAFSELIDKLAEGRYLEAGDRLHAFIGVGLAERLDIGLGRRLILTAQDGAGDIVGQLVRVVGLFRTGVQEIDEALVHIPRETAASWLGVGDDLTSVGVLLGSSRDVDPVLQALRDGLDEPAIEILGWREALPELDAAVRLDDYGDHLFHGILLTIVALAIVNTILLSVLYRTREFGVLGALGLTRRETGLVVFSEGVFLTTISGMIGAAAGLGITWLLFRNGLDLSFALDSDLSMSGVLIDPVIVPEFHVDQVIRSIIYVAVIGVLSSLYPAWYATRIDLAEAVKVET